MERVVLPEYLDSLPLDHKDALKNRRELRLFNFYLGTHSWFKRQLSRLLNESDRIIEIGAGEGYLVQYLSGFFDATKGRRYDWTALDCLPAFKGDRNAVNLVVDDLIQFKNFGDFQIVIGNMILHQFEKESLGQLGEQLRRCRVLVFQEPLRSRIHHGLCRLATLPMGRVTRHDAAVSIRAGFRRGELAPYFGLLPDEWAIHETVTLRGAYRFVAIRK